MKKIITPILILMMLSMIIPLSACSSNSAFSNTILQFSFATSQPSDSSDEKTIFINNDMDKLLLNGDLKVDSGSVKIEVVNSSSNEVAWSGDYKKDTNFNIELTNVKSQTEYDVKISTVQSKKVSLKITSDDKLAKNIKKPDKPTQE